jgi:hypothetical protein
MLARAIIGICRPSNSKVQFLTEELPVPTTLPFVIRPDSLVLRARFVGRCVTERCQHWSGVRCRLGQAVAATETKEKNLLPTCAIREKCRWFHENGASACNPCQHLRYLPMSEQYVSEDQRHAS